MAVTRECLANMFTLVALWVTVKVGIKAYRIGKEMDEREGRD